MYLLDANILSEALYDIPNKKVMERLAQHEGRLATAAIVWHEMLFGVYRLPQSRRRRRFERYIAEDIPAAMSILSYGDVAAQWHARERARLTAIGKTPPFADGQIAAVAAVNDLVLVTRNLSDYQHFADVKVETWHA